MRQVVINRCYQTADPLKHRIERRRFTALSYNRRYQPADPLKLDRHACYHLQRDSEFR
jgi:hypothetical protein